MRYVVIGSKCSRNSCSRNRAIVACIAGAMHRKENGTVTNVGGEQECTGCCICVMPP